MLFPIQLNVLQTYHCGMYAYRRSSADRSAMIRIRVDLIRADLDQGQKVLLICGFRSGSSADRSVLGLRGHSHVQENRNAPREDGPVSTRAPMCGGESRHVQEECQLGVRRRNDTVQSQRRLLSNPATQIAGWNSTANLQL